jgi:hypothetical protein
LTHIIANLFNKKRRRLYHLQVENVRERELKRERGKERCIEIRGTRKRERGKERVGREKRKRAERGRIRKEGEEEKGIEMRVGESEKE